MGAVASPCVAVPAGEEPGPQDLQILVEHIAERIGRALEKEVRYQLKTPYRDGTTHLVIEPLDFMARLAALVPPPANWHGHRFSQAVDTPARVGARAPPSQARLL